VVPLDRFSRQPSGGSAWPTAARRRALSRVIPAILLQLPVTEVERQHRVRFAFAGVDVRHRATFEERYRIRSSRPGR